MNMGWCHSLVRKSRVIVGFLLINAGLFAQESVELSFGKPSAIIDLKTKDGVTLVKGEWRYTDAQIVDKDFKAPGPSADDKLALYPTGKPIKTHDIFPKAGAIDFNDSKWEKLDATSLELRRGTGLLSFNWYRMNVTIPEKLGNFSVEGSTIVFEIVMDDYAEIFVDGKLNKSPGQAGGSVAKGWNARNRVTLTNNAKPGQKIQIAVLGINGPIADLPENYIWVRSATLDFYKSFPKNPEWQNLGEVVKIDNSLDKIIAPGTKLEKLATGFQFTEGPAWHPDGYLVYSDPNTNVIYAYKPENGNVEIYRTKSGYAGINIGEYHQAGSNGLTFDKEGRLIVCQHGERRVVRIEKKGPVTILADNYQGKKLNSPNDLVLRSDGTLFFTDPPYGLPMAFNDARKETPHSGVYAVVNGQVKLLTTDLKGPNGIAFSPDEKYLYVSNWDITDIHNTKVIMRYEAAKDGSLTNGKIFFDMNKTDGEDALDGLKVDTQGNVFCSGPDGIWIISADGKYLGRIKTPEHAANMAWGEDGHTMFITASSGLYKIHLLTEGKLASR
ncbi:MAG: SMP-30/gluconolactonase/LRE family protein [Cyclobacteriaceae bacterium]